jgi:hypothetical protein
MKPVHLDMTPRWLIAVALVVGIAVLILVMMG